MRKPTFLTTLLVLCAIGASTTLRAQYVGLSTDPVGLILGFPSLSVEVPVGPQFSLVANGSFIAGYNALESDGDRVGGTQLSLRARYFVRRDGAQRGFFPMVYVRHRSTRFTYIDDDSFLLGRALGYDFSLRTLSGGIGVGYLHETKAGLTLSAELGIGRTFTSRIENHRSNSELGNLLALTLRDAAGIDGLANVGIGWRIR